MNARSQHTNTIEGSFDADRLKHLLSFAKRMDDRWDDRILATDLESKSNSNNALDIFIETLSSIDEYLVATDSHSSPTSSSILIRSLRDKITEELSLRGFQESEIIDNTFSNLDFQNQEQIVAKLRNGKSQAYDLSRHLDLDMFVAKGYKDDRETILRINEILKNPGLQLPDPIAKALLSAVEEKEIEAMALLGGLKQQSDPLFTEIITSVEASLRTLQFYRDAFDSNSPVHSNSRQEMKESIGKMEGDMHRKHGKNADLINDVHKICKDEETGNLGAAYKRLMALGVTEEEIIKIANDLHGDASVLGSDRIAELQEKLNSIQSAMHSKFLENKFPTEIGEVKSLFSSVEIPKKDAGSLISGWVQDSLAFLRNEIATAESYLVSGYDQKKDEEGKPIPNTYNAKPDAAFLLVGQQRASNSMSWPAVGQRYDRMLAIFESKFCKLVIENKLYDPDSGQDPFIRTKGITEVFTLVPDDELIPKLHETHEAILQEFPPIDESKLTDEKKADRISERQTQYLIRLESVTPVYENANLEGAELLDRYVDLLRKSKRAVVFDKLVDESVITNHDERWVRQVQADEMLRTLYTNIQSRETRKVVHYKLDDLINKAREDRDTRLKDISTAWTRFTHNFKSAAYKLNTLGGWSLKLVDLTGTITTSIFAVTAVGAFFVSAPLALPFVAAGLLCYFPKWALRPVLGASVDLAKEGREHEQEAANLKLAAQQQRLKESTDNVDMWIAIYVTMLEDNIDRFEPTNLNRRAHLRYFTRCIMSAQGIIEPLAENRGIVREDVGLSNGFVTAISVIAGGWSDVTPDRRRAVEKAIKKVGFAGKQGNDAWRAFVSSYGDGNPKSKNQSRNILPIPDKIRAIPIFDQWARSTIPYEKRQENDLSIVMRNIFGDDMVLTLAHVNQLRIQPDGPSLARTLSDMTSRVNGKMPSFGEGKDGRNAQLTRRASVLNFLGHLLAETDVRTGKKK